MSDCIFCKILEKKAPASFIYEDPECAAFLDIHPINEGHILIIPRTHSKNFTGIKEQEVAAMFRAAQKIVKALSQTSIHHEGVNLLLSDGESAGQEVMHSHLHIIPRYKGDGQRSGFKHSSSSRAKLEKVSLEIRSQLSN